jgi:hypothetical protein
MADDTWKAGAMLFGVLSAFVILMIIGLMVNK